MTYYTPSLLPVQINADGSVVRTIGTRFEDSLNVKDFGAVGDGNVDDTTSVQSAINAALILNISSVYFPPGQYLLDTISLIPGLYIQGAGFSNTLLISRDATKPIFDYTTPINQPSYNINISGFSFFDGLAHPYTGTAISLNGVNQSSQIYNIQISDCYFGALSAAIFATYCQNIRLNNLLAEDCEFGYIVFVCGQTSWNNCTALNGGAGSLHGFWIDNLTLPLSQGDNHKLVNCATYNQGGGLLISDTTNVSLTNCSFIQTQSGLHPLTVVNSTNINVHSSVFSSGTLVANLDTAIVVDSQSTRVNLVGNTIYDSFLGILVEGSQHTISSNSLSGNQAEDITLNNSTGCTIVGNSCRSSGAAITDSIVETGADYNTIIGNTCSLLVTPMGTNTISANNITSIP
jgi:parallel beta-helix repeat protein